MSAHQTQASDPERPPLQSVLFEDRMVRVGTFRATPGHPDFEDSGPIREHVVVFPRKAVWIEPADSRGFVADTNYVTYYNRGQVYRRGRVDPGGDDSVWIAPAPGLLDTTLADLGLEPRDSGPFAWPHGLADPEAYFLQVALVRYLETSASADPQVIEETVLGVLGRLLLAKAHELGHATPPPPDRQRDLVERTRELVNLRFGERLTISRIGSEVACSPFHLSRLFRSRVGLPIAAYRNQIRLRTALLRLHDAPDLTELALDLGYSSHSHFTAAFSDVFEVPPSRARRDWSRKRLKRLLHRLDPECR